MTALVWDQIKDRRYEAGVDHGVFYPLDGPGVPWNGLLSVQESFVGGEVTPHYLDGVKILDAIGGKNYQATVKAFSAPEEYSAYSGRKDVIPGFSLTNQPKRRFNFAYRTGLNDGYKLHLVYNVLATPIVGAYETIGAAINISQWEWKFDATPVAVPGFKPAAHFVVDSKRTPAKTLSKLENMLYGTISTAPVFPTIAELTAIFTDFNPDSIPGLTLWLKADSLVMSDGTPIAMWQNLVAGSSPYNDILAQRPVYKASSLNGKPGVRFDGGDDALWIDMLSTQTWAFVCSHLDAGPNFGFYSRMIDSYPVNSHGIFGVYNEKRYSPPHWGNVPANKCWVNGVQTVNAGDVIATPRVVIAEAAALHTATHLIGDYMPDAGKVNLGGQPFNGDMGEILTYSRALTTAERESIEGYLRSRWGTP